MCDGGLGSTDIAIDIPKNEDVLERPKMLEEDDELNV